MQAAKAKVEANLYQATGRVINITKLSQLQSIKDNEGRYIQSGEPFARPIGTIWSMPVVGTPAIDFDEFLVGDFANQAQIFDRETAVVELSSDHDTYFTRNLLAVRAEERLAFSVKAPLAFVMGSFSYISG